MKVNSVIDVHVSIRHVTPKTSEGIIDANITCSNMDGLHNIVELMLCLYIACEQAPSWV